MGNTLLVIFAAASVKYHLPDGLLMSLCYVESRHNIEAVHEKDGDSDSLGICQIKLKTAQWRGFKGSAKELMLPRVNIEYAAAYLAYQLKRYDGDITKAVIAYNIGNAKGLTETQYSIKVKQHWLQMEGGL